MPGWLSNDASFNRQHAAHVLTSIFVAPAAEAPPFVSPLFKTKLKDPILGLCRRQKRTIIPLDVVPRRMSAARRHGASIRRQRHAWEAFSGAITRITRQTSARSRTLAFQCIGSERRRVSN